MWPFLVTLAFVLSDLVYGSHAQQQHYLPLHAQKPQVITRELRQYINGLLEEGGIPGLSLGVVHSGGVVEVEGFGRRSEDDTKTTPETLFNIASCSKAFTASALGILMDDFAHGRNVTPLPESVRTFDWHTKVQDILPHDWKLLDEWASQKASLRDILSHQSGLPGHDYSYTASDTPQDIVRRLRHLRPTYELRQKYQYNNLMYILASHVVALYSGTSFADFVQTRIWDPLNMTSSTYSLVEASKTGRLTEAWATNSRRIPNVFEQPGASFVAAGAGGVISSVQDLTKWIGALLNEDVNPTTNKTVLPLSVFEAMTFGYIVTNPRPPEHSSGPLSSLTAYGLGWERTTYRGHELIVHGGSITGFSSYVAFSPSAKLGIAVLANGDLVHAQELAIIDKIITDFLSASTLTPAFQQPKLQTPFRQTNHSDNLCFEATTDTVPIAEFAGTYSSAGYQDLTLCDPKASSSTTVCKDVLDTFGKFDDLSASHDTLYAVFDNIVTSHVRFRRLSNTTFRAQTTSLYPNGYGRDKSAFELEVPVVAAGIVEFVFDNDRLVGAGLNFGSDDVSMRIRAGGSIKETSEVWYEKV